MIYENEQNLPNDMLQEQAMCKQKEPPHMVTEKNDVKGSADTKKTVGTTDENKEHVLMPRFDKVSISEGGWEKFSGKSTQLNIDSENKKENYLNGNIMKFRCVKK